MHIERNALPADGPRAQGSSDVVLAATLYLLSAYGLGRHRTQLPTMIARHLDLLAARTDLDPVVRETCAQLRKCWMERAGAEASAGRRPSDHDSAFARFKQRLTG